MVAHHKFTLKKKNMQEKLKNQDYVLTSEPEFAIKKHMGTILQNNLN